LHPIRTHPLRRLRIPAIVCALSVLLCELIAHPFANMSICDDGPYILMVQHLAATGHIAYNAWAAPMLTWQLYLAALLVKLFGFSFTVVRSSTLLVAMALAFVLQRTLVRSGINERNATIGTLAFILSPLYLMLSVTFMTDIHGLFAIVLCLYACLRALQSSSQRSTIAWLCFAVAANALIGTSRQIAWLGILTILPSTLWLLRAQRRTLLAGTAATLSGIAFIFACLHWLKLQPYSIPEHLLPDTFPLARSLGQLTYLFLDAPFLLLPLFALYLPQLRRATPRVLTAIATLFAAYLFLAIYPSHLRGNFPLEPMLFNGNWVSVHGIYEGVVSLSDWHSTPPLFLHTGERILLTIVSLGGLAGLLISLARSRNTPGAPGRAPSELPSLAGVTGLASETWETTTLPWRTLAVLLIPFSAANILLLLPRSTTLLFDRYLPPLLLVATLLLVRFYQERIRPRLPSTSILLIAIMAIYGIACTHNMFSLYRARVALAAELRANNVPDTSVDNGWEYNLDVELQHSNHINFPTIAVPANAYIPMPPPPTGICQMLWYNYTPHIHPLYGVSFQPNVCNGPAPFAPIHYSRWLASPGTLYAVRYTQP
jgi:hypothetical protein